MSPSSKNQVSRLVTKVRKLYNRNEPLNLSAAKRRFPDLVESAYAVKPFLGWRKLLIAAEINYEDIEREYLNYVICEICGKKFGILTGHIMKKHDITPDEYHDEFPDAEMMSEILRIERRGWAKKPINPQTTFPHWEELWTPEYILDRIEAYRERGGPLNFRTISSHDKSTTDVAINYFGSWDAAMARIGIHPDDYRQLAPGKSLSPEEVIEELKERQKTGLPLNWKALHKSDLRLYNAARRRFGSYSKALEASGIDVREVNTKKQYYDEDINAIMKAARRINRLTGQARLKALKKIDQRYRSLIYNRYKNWRVFAEKFGFDPKKFSFYEQEDDLIPVIKKLPSDTTANRLYKENRSLYCKIWKRMGPVSKVLRKYHPVGHVLRKGVKKTGAKGKKKS